MKKILKLIISLIFTSFEVASMQVSKDDNPEHLRQNDYIFVQLENTEERKRNNYQLLNDQAPAIQIESVIYQVRNVAFNTAVADLQTDLFFLKLLNRIYGDFRTQNRISYKLRCKTLNIILPLSINFISIFLYFT